MPQAVAPAGAGLLDVGAGLGKGILRVLRQKDPSKFDGGLYESKVPLLEGKGLSHQLSHFLEQSEQTRSAVLLGVLVKPEGVAAAGGLMLEALPGTDEDLAMALESRLADLDAVSRLLEEGGTDKLRAEVLGAMDQELLETNEISYRCSCDRERFRLHIVGLSADDREHVLAERDDAPIEVECNFCGELYRFSPEEISPGFDPEAGQDGKTSDSRSP